MIKIGPLNLSRRNMLRAFAVGAITGIGGVSLTMRGANGLFDDILKRSIGRFEMNPADRDKLRDETSAYVKALGAKNLSIRIMGAGYAALNFPFVRHLLPEDGLFKVEQFERQVVTFFLLSTDYLAIVGDHPDKTLSADKLVSFVGYTGICIDPWAQFT